MLHRRGVMWLKSFRESSEKVAATFADDFLFEDLIVAQSITDRGEFERAMGPYANADLDNGIGVHQFRIDEVIGDERCELIRWTWEAHGAASFFGIPTNGKVVGCVGYALNVYEGGKIKLESVYWDATKLLHDLGQPVSLQGVTAPRVSSADDAARTATAGPSYVHDVPPLERVVGAPTSENQEHAERWARLLTSDTDAAVDLFADELVYDDRQDVDHVDDTATDKTQLRERLAPYANADADNGLGIHRFEVLGVVDAVGAGCPASRAVYILWKWTGEHLDSFRGVPTGGQALYTRGGTWQQFDADGKVDREMTCWNDVPVFQQLGLPVHTPRYWDADFDPSVTTPVWG